MNLLTAVGFRVPGMRQPDTAMNFKAIFAVGALAIGAVLNAQVITVPKPSGLASGALSPSAARRQVTAEADAAVRHFAKEVAKVSRDAINERIRLGLWDPRVQFSLPTVVKIQGSGSSTGSGGSGVGTSGFHGKMTAYGSQIRSYGSGGLTLQFDSTGSEAFPTAYQQVLQNVFNTVTPTLNILFGAPAVSGTVHVANFDATIGDRQAVAGGYYMPDNGSGVPEIRFPVYSAGETAAVNFVHCILLAYLGPDGYSNDAFEEGLVRAVTMKAVRTAGAMPSSLDAQGMENVLEAEYDILGFYDWDNQRALSCQQFIAPNLVNSSLPASGGTGLFLTRYMMAGSAWAKVLAEYPGFAAALNQAVYASPSLGSNVPGLIQQCQTIISGLRPTDPTVEGFSFADWFARQYVLQPSSVFGTRLFVQAIPISPSTGDFGVFAITGTLFSADASGNETLLSSYTSYPIFWDDQFQRVNTSSQDLQLTYSGGDGSVEPNFPDLYATKPYRTVVDLPAYDQDARVMLPVAAAYTSAGVANDFYGTVAGVALATGDTLTVNVTINGTTVGSFPVTNDAFGGVIGIAGGYANGGVQCTVTLVKSSQGAQTTLLTRRIDKPGPGSLAAYMNVSSDLIWSPVGGLPAGLSMIGMPLDPYSNDPATILGQPAGSLLAARYNSSTVSYDFYPKMEPFTGGHAYFIDLPNAVSSLTIDGQEATGLSRVVALKPGWNMITAPTMNAIQTSNVRVVHASDFPTDFASSEGTLIGKDFFYFAPGAIDPAAGSPQSGTFSPGASFTPGVGYFVEVLAPEGVTLVFDPASSAAGPQKGAPGGAPNGWEMQAIFTDASQQHQTSVILGGIRGATNGISPQYSTPLPPGFGGFQAMSERSGQNLFRDERPYGRPQMFTLTATGLMPGQKYTLHFEHMAGIIRSFTVYNVQTGQATLCGLGSQLTFAASGQSASFMIQVNGR